MELKSGAGIVCYVKDIPTTVAFYERAGFTFKLKEPTRATSYINWWWIDFHQIDAADTPAWHVSPPVDNERTGALFYFSVDNVRRAYEELTAAGVPVASEPTDLRGKTEFTVVDPDGHRLVFFTRR